MFGVCGEHVDDGETGDIQRYPRTERGGFEVDAEKGKQKQTDRKVIDVQTIAVAGQPLGGFCQNPPFQELEYVELTCCPQMDRTKTPQNIRP
jgi:hypothetical protein